MSPPGQRAWVLAFVGLSGLGCDRSPPSPSAPVVEAAPATAIEQPSDRARAEETAALVSWLRAQRQSEARFFAPRVLYTWTRAEQIAELRANPVLLTRSRGAGGAQSGFDHALAGDRSPLARHLRSTRWSARRFAWTSPWATRRGWPSADYGDRLVRVELRDEAWIARFDPDGAGPRWEVRDAAGEVIDEREVRAQPWRVAAVYHQGRGPGPDGSERVWREYVLVSEPMIARWSVGDHATARVMERDRTQLAVLAERLEGPSAAAPTQDEWTRALVSRWRAGDDGELVSLYESSLALGSELYVPSPSRVREIVRALELPEEEPLSHTPHPVLVRGARPSPPPAVSARPPVRQRWCDPTMGCVP